MEAQDAQNIRGKGLIMELILLMLVFALSGATMALLLFFHPMAAMVCFIVIFFIMIFLMIRAQ